MHYKNKTLSDKINEFWNLNSIGICDKESSVMKNVFIKLNLVITGMKLIYRLNTKTQF